MTSLAAARACASACAPVTLPLSWLRATLPVLSWWYMLTPQIHPNSLFNILLYWTLLGFLMKKTHVFSRALAVNLNFIRRCYVLVGMWGGQSSWLSLVEISERISIGTMDPISKYDNPFQFQMFALRVTASCFLPCHWTNCPCQRFQATPNNNSTKQSSKKTPLQHFETQFLPEKSPKKPFDTLYTGRYIQEYLDQDLWPR